MTITFDKAVHYISIQLAGCCFDSIADSTKQHQINVALMHFVKLSRNQHHRQKLEDVCDRAIHAMLVCERL
jgi:hypothetical protein